MAAHDTRATLRRWGRRAIVPALVLLALVVTVDDWSRDFSAYSAEIAEDGSRGGPRPLVSDRPAAQLAVAARWAAFRLRGWEYVGTARQGAETSVSLVRTTRLLRLRDDVTVRIHDRGDRRVVSATSRSRTAIGDLGRNPRNLHRLFLELDTVLGNAARDPAPLPGTAE